MEWDVAIAALGLALQGRFLGATMGFTRIDFERQGHKAVITLNRPEALNAVDSKMDKDLLAAFTEVRDDPDIWVCIVTGAGDRAFSAGHDMKEEGPPPFDPTPRTPPLGGLYRNTKVWKPIIAAANGYCLGAGLELALSCDIRIAAEHAQFGLPEVRWSLLAAAGGLTRIHRMMPRAAAMKMVLTGAFISAQEAYQWGLVTDVVALPDLMPLAHRMADTILENAPIAVQMAKEIAIRTADMNVEDGLALESAFSRNLALTEDKLEGPRAFAEKRQPAFKGR